MHRRDCVILEAAHTFGSKNIKILNVLTFIVKVHGQCMTNLQAVFESVGNVESQSLMCYDHTQNDIDLLR